MNVAQRARRILLEPTREWPVIAAEPHTVQSLFTQYAMILAGVPAIAGFIGFSIMGVPIAASVSSMMLGYVLSLGSVYALALLIDVLAPHFHSRRDFTQSLKIATFSSTAAWVAGAFQVLPALAILALLGSLYALYLLYLGIAIVKQPPPEQAIAYAMVVVLAMIVLMVVAGTIPALAIPAAMRGF